jgi:hypothetical protein
MYIHNLSSLQILAVMFQIYFSWVFQVIWKARYKFPALVFFLCIPWNDLNKIFIIFEGRPNLYRYIHYFIQELSVATSCLLSFPSRTLDRPPTGAVEYQGIVIKAICQAKRPRSFYGYNVGVRVKEVFSTRRVRKVKVHHVWADREICYAYYVNTAVDLDPLPVSRAYLTAVEPALFEWDVF